MMLPPPWFSLWMVFSVCWVKHNMGYFCVDYWDIHESLSSFQFQVVQGVEMTLRHRKCNYPWFWNGNESEPMLYSVIIFYMTRFIHTYSITYNETTRRRNVRLIKSIPRFEIALVCIGIRNVKFTLHLQVFWIEMKQKRNLKHFYNRWCVFSSSPEKKNKQRKKKWKFLINEHVHVTTRDAAVKPLCYDMHKH